jgi:hypothetical protein
MRIIRASEIGSFLYCQRSWWYQRQGKVSENQAGLEAGSEFHRQHGTLVVKARLLAFLGWTALLCALVLAAVGVTLALLH